MACFKPVEAVIDGFERVRIGHGIQDREQGRPLWLPCGFCMGCRLKKQRDWALRCQHEAQMHKENCFITLTYDDKNYEPSLKYEDFQEFMRALRKQREHKFKLPCGTYRIRKEIRFFVAGEYGEKSGRPHFHALLFGEQFERLQPIGRDLYRSPILEELWNKGFSSIGTVTPQSCMYVAKYCCKTVFGEAAEKWYLRTDLRTGELVKVKPEFAKMSLKPGIGQTWIKKYWKDVYAARDGVVQKGGQILPSPRYYDRKLLEWEPDLREHKDYERYVKAGHFQSDCTPERLKERETVARANHQRRRTVL